MNLTYRYGKEKKLCIPAEKTRPGWRAREELTRPAPKPKGAEVCKL